MRTFLPLFSVLFIASCGGDHAADGHHGMPPPQVGVAAPIMRELATERQLTGTIEAIEVVQLNPQVSGLVTRVYVADGAEVKAGEAILDIEKAPFIAAAERASAEVARAESRAHIANLQLQRGKNLVADKVISVQQFDDLEAAVKIAGADVAAAKAALVTAQLDLGYTKVSAPINGRIGKILTTVGNLVQGGGPVPPTYITTLVSLDQVYVTFDVDENTWNVLGGKLRASLTGGEPVPVAVGLIGENGHPHLGKVVFVDNRIDQGSGSIRVRAKLENRDRQLTPGAFARVRLQIAPPKPVILVHERAILSQINTRYVYTVGDDQKTQMRPIRLGESVGALRIVEEGLSTTDSVVVIGHAKLFMPNMQIAPQPANMETAIMTVPVETAPPAPGKPAESQTSEGAKP